MKIDRAAFLAFATSLAAATGCASTADDDDVSGDEAAVSAGGGEICYSADESTTRSEWWAGMIGFDPVNDVQAADDFCLDIASKPEAGGQVTFDSSVYWKCNAYASVYVPHVVYTTYHELEARLRPDMDSAQKWSVFQYVDGLITAVDSFCVTPADRDACRDAADSDACLRASTQMVPEAKERLRQCVANWDVYTCIEGASEELRPM